MDYSMTQRNVGSTVSDLKDRFAPQISQVREQVAIYGDQAAKYIRANPVPSLVGAVVAGFVLGRIVSRI